MYFFLLGSARFAGQTFFLEFTKLLFNTQWQQNHTTLKINQLQNKKGPNRAFS